MTLHTTYEKCVIVYMVNFILHFGKDTSVNK